VGHTLSVIFVGLGVAEIDEQPIAEVLRNMPLKAGDHLGAGVLIGPHHLAEVFRIELAGEGGGVDQVTEQHGELAAFGVWERGRRSDCGNGARSGGCRRPAGPDQDSAILVHGQFFGINEILLEVLQQVVIELEAAFEDAVGETLLLLEEGENLGQYGIIIHYRPSICDRAASAWGSQNVMSMARYIVMAVDSAIRACSRWPVWPYNRPSPW
jgi:hypothetical protein